MAVFHLIIWASVIALSLGQVPSTDTISESLENERIDSVFSVTTQKPQSTTLFLNQYNDTVTQKDLESQGATEECGEGSDAGKRVCVTYYRCDPDTNTVLPPEQPNITPGEDDDFMIDIRAGVNSCPNIMDVCCKVPLGGLPPVTPSPTITTSTTTVEPTSSRPTARNFCGIRNNNGIDFKITGNKNNEAEYGEFPWMTAILKKNYNPKTDDSLALCGGAILTPRIILTAAHCVNKFKPSELKVRAGEWETQSDRERLPFQERDIRQIIIHPQFHEKRLNFDVAILVLSSQLNKAEHLGTICMPAQNAQMTSRQCYATGWGKDVFGREGVFQAILKKRELPIVPRRQCEQMLRGTRLGQKFNLHETFICAGGQAGVDTCTGDGGSPLVCPDPAVPGRYILAGMVAWGIGCGAPDVPGVYVNAAYFRTWLDQQMAALNEDTRPYQL